MTRPFGQEIDTRPGVLVSRARVEIVGEAPTSSRSPRNHARCVRHAPRCAVCLTLADAAAHLVDRVLPAVPVRQWVLSLSFELRGLAAFRADALSALNRLFVEEVLRRYAARAKKEGFVDAPTGAVTHVQRFGSSLNLNVHFHVMVLLDARDPLGRLVAAASVLGRSWCPPRSGAPNSALRADPAGSCARGGRLAAQSLKLAGCRCA